MGRLRCCPLHLRDCREHLHPHQCVFLPSFSSPCFLPFPPFLPLPPNLRPHTLVLTLFLHTVVQPHCYGGLCALILLQILHYDRKWNPWLAYGAGFSIYAIVCAGFEVAMVYACRAAEHKHLEGPTMFFGILSAFALGIGFVYAVPLSPLLSWRTDPDPLTDLNCGRSTSSKRSLASRTSSS
jgi:hypothetical protein